jgi:hypothetical protein
MVRHVAPESAYLVQVGLIEPGTHEPFAGSHWEAARSYITLRVDWVDEDLDFERGVSRQRSRIEVLSGERAGEVLEEIHDMTLWTPATWARAVDASPFEETATYDGGRKDECAPVGRDATGGLLWHELRPRDRRRRLRRRRQDAWALPTCPSEMTGRPDRTASAKRP